MEVSLAVSLSLILAAIIASELRASSAVLEIFAGVTLVTLMPDIAHADWLTYLAHLGMLALMFVAGFELQVNKFKTIWKPSGLIGILSFVTPFAGIYLFTRYALSFEEQTALLTSVGLSTTSLALVYHVLKEHGMLDSHEGQVIFGAASIVDIMSMIALAILLGNIGWGTALFILFFIVSAVGLPHFGAWIFRRYPNSLAEPELRFLLVMLVGMGFMAENVGSVHPALVAFSLGMVMTGLLEKNEAVKDKLMSLVFSFFAPIFFLEAGTRIDIHVLTLKFFMIGVALFILATSLKFIGSYIPAKLAKLGNLRFVGILFNYRLSFGIITANVGLERHILSQETYAIILLVILVSAALPGVLLRHKNDGAAAGTAA